MRAFSAFVLCTVAMACTPLPDINAPIPAGVADTDFPILLPLGDLAAPADELDTQATEAELNARVAGLRARAEALRNRPTE